MQPGKGRSGGGAKRRGRPGDDKMPFRRRMQRRKVCRFCAERMPYFCVPRYVEVLDEIPKNAIGRVRKDVLRNRGCGAGAWDRDAHGYVLSR